MRNFAICVQKMYFDWYLFGLILAVFTIHVCIHFLISSNESEMLYLYTVHTSQPEQATLHYLLYALHVHKELLPPGVTMNPLLYTTQLTWHTSRICCMLNSHAYIFPQMWNNSDFPELMACPTLGPHSLLAFLEQCSMPKKFLQLLLEHLSHVGQLIPYLSNNPLPFLKVKSYNTSTIKIFFLKEVGKTLQSPP